MKGGPIGTPSPPRPPPQMIPLQSPLTHTTTTTLSRPVPLISDGRDALDLMRPVRMHCPGPGHASPLRRRGLVPASPSPPGPSRGAVPSNSWISASRPAALARRRCARVAVRGLGLGRRVPTLVPGWVWIRVTRMVPRDDPAGSKQLVGVAEIGGDLFQLSS